jgi:S-DNA-T family DNA segregation ATPase FtsK/SpoIIIE
MALSLSLHNSPERMRLLLIDATGDGVAFAGMDGLPHLACPVAISPMDALASLRWAVRTLARRKSAADDMDSGELFSDDEESAQSDHAQAGRPSLVIMIDGADNLLSTANPRFNAEAEDALNRLIAEGNKRDIHLVVSSERPDLGLQVDWGARITGATVSAEMARMATGMKGSGAQGLLGSGDFLIALNAELLRFQAGAVSSAEVDKAVELINSWANSPRSQENYIPDNITLIPPRPERVPEEPIPLRRSWVGE